ncbi:hypothetical protein R3P38DRAFT_2521728 [Favolaschia claudopus]|uniref:ubiquitinyl hydrolase 1 n=1 Tax=Favolaschia claudopus TaxID=2862362 RepID=A0AAW0BWC2_9AGAR
MDQPTLEYAIHHLFVPPKLPQEDDGGDPNVLLGFLEHIADCGRLFVQGLGDENVDIEVLSRWKSVQRMFDQFVAIHRSGSLSHTALQIAITEMQVEDVLCFHVRAQNAGIILRRRDEEILVEFFQASSPASMVTKTKGKLVVQYPFRPRLSIPPDAACIQALSTLLADLDSTSMPDAIPKTKKAGNDQEEIREVADIRYVSELVGGIVRSLTPADKAEEIAASTVYVTKRINDHVLWKSALLPWRRSPKWLILRVALQTTLAGWDLPEIYGYKAFVTFILATTLQLAQNFRGNEGMGIDKEVLFILNAKIAGRMWKLRSSLHVEPSPPFPIASISNVIQSVAADLNRSWKHVQDSNTRGGEGIGPSAAEIEDAKKMTLPHSSSYLETVRGRSETLSNSTNSFDRAAFEEKLEADSRREEKCNYGVSSTNLWFLVGEMERKVSSSSPDLASLPYLSDSIIYYNEMASSFKGRNPEIFSRLFLLVLELWVALDKVATNQFSLLLDYSPELSITSFEPLLLPELVQMQRLHNIEVYVKSRHARATYPDLSVFSHDFSPHSLPARYFAISSDLQTLKSTIERQGSEQKQQKLNERARRSAQYDSLLQEVERREHDCYTVTDPWGCVSSRRMCPSCTRCATERQAKDMRITLFEWPLPEQNVSGQHVVFELRAPEAFGIWRDTTFCLAQSHAAPCVEKECGQAEVVLEKYSSLRQYFVPYRQQRITLASTAKSFLQSHYSQQRFPCTDSNVVKHHPLTYRLYDRVGAKWLPSAFPVIDIRSACTPELPSPYQSIRWTMEATTHAPNQVLAQQSKCPRELSYHEWESFGHLRAGTRLQWRNMIPQLINGVVDLAHPGVHLLIQQAAWQSECALEHETLGRFREAHLDLSQEDFGIDIVRVLGKRLESVAGNWKESWTAATLVVLASRVLSLTPHETVKQAARDLLLQLRQQLFVWMNEVLDQLSKLSESSPESAHHRSTLVNRVLQLAASCRQTYAVEYLKEILSEREALSMFLQCAVHLHINTPPATAALPSAVRCLLDRDVALAVHTLELEAFSLSSEGLDDAVHAIWQGFSRGSVPWQMIGPRWIGCVTSCESADAQALFVHLDLLSGRLLVNGHTQGSLPKEIIGHSFFRLLFPTRANWDVVPSTMKGMEYQSRDNMEHFEVHFRLDGKGLLVRIRNGRSVSEFIPPNQLEGDIPSSLISGMIHIFHEQTQSLQFYPTARGWRPDDKPAWSLDIASPSRCLHSISDSSERDYVLNPVSSVVQKLSSVFRPLEALATNLTVLSRSKKLHVMLPRYDLEFSTDCGGRCLESSDLPGYFVSPVQFAGTLVGLSNKLVLESSYGEMTRVLVPHGSVAITKGELHPQVSISPSVNPSGHIDFFSFEIDTLLGRIVCSDGSLVSWYQLAYLHAATTSYLPDPLTHCTGVCQAQDMLESAQAFAFMRLERPDQEVLQHILYLVPVRKYYPTHLTSMETVDWHKNLSMLVQCARFVPLVQAIFNYAERQMLFYPSERPVTAPSWDGKIDLWERADFRTSGFVSDVRHDACDDVVSHSRCLENNESVEKEYSVARITALVRQWPMRVDFSSGFKLWDHLERWDTFSSSPSRHDKLDNYSFWLKDSPSSVWFRLFHLCRDVFNKDQDEHRLLVALAILSYRHDIDPDLTLSLLAIATNATNTCLRKATSRIPLDHFQLNEGRQLTRVDVSNTVSQHSHSSHPDPSWPERRHLEEFYDWERRRETAFRQEREQSCKTISDSIFSRWPTPNTEFSDLSSGDVRVMLPDTLLSVHPVVKFSDLRMAVEALFGTRLRNRRLFERCTELQSILNVACANGASNSLVDALHPLVPSSTMPQAKYTPVTLHSSPPCTQSASQDSLLRRLISDLEGMQIRGPKSRYIKDLSDCVDAFESHAIGNSAQHDLLRILGPQSLPELWMCLAGRWPSLGPRTLLQQLSREQRDIIPVSWKVTLCRFAEQLSIHQQRRRITVFRNFNQVEECIREGGTVGGEGWDPIEYADWLLVQLDADIFIRPVQANIAQQMISPDGLRNALMQLNMGEGKSSVIVPIISSALADGQQLVRVVVLKPLAAQMFQLLKQRVGGLVNRRLYYLPFSRDIVLDAAKVQKIFALFRECAENGGILLCQPEHILSFELMGLHALCISKDSEETRLLKEARDWLNDAARDVLDESDEILSVRYQLIYTVGASTAPDGRPWRWQITQVVFSLLQAAANASPHGLVIGPTTRPCQFPVIRILAGTTAGSTNLLDSVVHKIVFDDALQEWISFRNYSTAEKQLVSRFLQNMEIIAAEDQSLRAVSGERFAHLLLLRGLFAHGILNLSFREKRWRVDYGLDPRRTMLAVPYRAKDSPAMRAEFGHPDMIIVLTCLSYYYGGLTDEQLNTCFKLILNSDNPDAQYEYWVKAINDLPPSLSTLRGLNLDDLDQKINYIFPLLRLNKAVIDFYLAECVFPKAAREFPHKLTTNAWDLARTRPRLTTGFSGTNDNRYLLPLSIEQCDQASQLHTNALVLHHLLRPENRQVVCTESEDAMGLLRRVVGQNPPVRVLLDVGAQVLELQNVEVAKEWLELETDPQVEAAIYFHPSTDEIRVVLRDGRDQAFASSLYRKQLGKTLLYLDEAHTRGTDFKLPGGTRAVVTLGPRLTKDKLVQGCMRMRRLGKDHSVPDMIESNHVLNWAIQGTCRQIEENGSLWANQGVNFDQRHTAMQQYDQSSESYSSTVNVLLERESRTLEELYGVAGGEAGVSEPLSELQRDIHRRCQELGVTPSNSALSEEQERELAHEKEDEREVERIPEAKACEHRDRDLEYFIKTGTIRPSSTFVFLVDCLKDTTWIRRGLLPQGHLFRGGTGLYATRDFRDTIVVPNNNTATDNYLRPVQWVMSTAKSRDVLILVSPFEANKWLPEIRRSKLVFLHLYSPRTSRNTFWPLDKLDSFTVPAERSVPVNPQLLHELNLFAGQLFCADKRSMNEVCRILGLHMQSVGDVEELQGKVDSTGFVKDPGARRMLGLSDCTFVESPLPFFRDLVGARRKGQGFTLTHMGQILRGNDPKDPKFEQEEGGQ